MVGTECYSRENLLLRALDGMPQAAGAGEHLATCAACRAEVERLSAAASALKAGGTEALGDGDCLADEQISALAEGRPDAVPAAALSHLAACARCSARLAALVRLLSDDVLAAELRRLEPARARSSSRFRTLSLVGAATLAAAMLAGVMIRPAASPDAGPAREPGMVLRENAITTTVAPRIVAPLGRAAPGDSLRWTSVPHADRYQVLVFDREGRLAWGPQTRDTVLALPRDMGGDVPTTYLWKVEARTDWNRWVASEWEELTIDVRRSLP